MERPQSKLANTLYRLAFKLEKQKIDRSKSGNPLTTVLRIALTLSGFIWLTISGFQWHPIAGSVVAGVSCFALAWLSGDADQTETQPSPMPSPRR